MEPATLPEGRVEPLASLIDPRVLVIEDDDVMRDSISEILLIYGFRVAVAGDGAGALELAREQDFDAVVCDVRLPGMEGPSVVRNLRARERPPEVVMITAYPGWRVTAEAYASGVFSMMQKPLNLVALATLVGEAVRKRRSREEVER